MGKHIHFTSQRVDQFTCEPGKQQTIHMDGKVPGLGLRVTANGAKSYIFETRLHGRTIRITIGKPSNWPLKKAQERASELKVQTDQGLDPRQLEREKADEIQEVRDEQLRQDIRVQEAWNVYLAARQKRWSPRTYIDHQNHANLGGVPRAKGGGLVDPGPLASLMGLRLIELNPRVIVEWLGTEGRLRPTQTALSYRMLRAFVRWCSNNDDYKRAINIECVGSRVNKDHVPRIKAKADDCLQREQLHAWFKAVKSINSPVISAYLQALLLTGARREELAELAWSQVDFKWLSMRISDKVEDAGRSVPLTPYVALLLSELPRVNQWVFSSPTSKSGHLVEPRIQHNNALQIAGLPHVTIHGLRRSFGTLAEWVECPTGISAQIMGHKPSAIAEKHYRRRPLDLLRKWHCKIEEWILTEGGITFSPHSSIDFKLSTGDFYA
jgi:integrase